MPDEFYEKYAKLSHAELFAMLEAADAKQVGAQVSAWTTLQTSAGALSAGLAGDLRRLAEGWESDAGREAQHRIGLVAGYAQILADEYAAMQNGLAAMYSSLTQAMREVEPPDTTELVARTAAGGALTGLLPHLPTGVIGASMGHTRDPAEAQGAQRRIARLVAELAADYRVAEYQTWSRTVPGAPADMPQPPGQPTATPTAGTTNPGTTNPGATNPHTATGANSNPPHTGTGDPPVLVALGSPPGHEDQPPPAAEPPAGGDDGGKHDMTLVAVAGGVVTAAGIAIVSAGKDSGKGDGRHDPQGAGYDQGHGGVIGATIVEAQVTEVTGLEVAGTSDQPSAVVGEATSTGVGAPAPLVDAGVIGAQSTGLGEIHSEQVASTSPGTDTGHTSSHTGTTASTLASGGPVGPAGPMPVGGPGLDGSPGNPPPPVNTNFMGTPNSGLTGVGANPAATGLGGPGTPAGPSMGGGHGPGAGSPMRMEESRLAFEGTRPGDDPPDVEPEDLPSRAD